MEEALRAALLDAAPLTSRVARRIDWGLRSQGGALPAIAMHQISGLVMMNLAGSSGWSRSRVQLDCWGRTALGARDVAQVVADPRTGLLVGFRGDRSGVRLRTFVLGRRSDDDADAQGPLFRDSVDLMVWHTTL